MRTIDLFAGCGGLSLGLSQAGFDIQAACDNWQPAVNVYRKNFTRPIYQMDLASLKGDYGEFAKHQPECIVGGPPCQDFSSAGNQNFTGQRASLTSVFANAVNTLKPKWFIMENVSQAIKSPTYQQAIESTKRAGYDVILLTLDASLCGVPQRRKRLFCIGEYKAANNNLSNFILQRLDKKPMTIRDYLGDKLGIEHYYRHPRNYQRRGIYSIDEPSPTIRGINRPLPKGYPGHKADTASISYPGLRALTTQERSLLQTFPESFQWGEENKTQLDQMIGNAVPVNLAFFVGACIKEYIKSQA